MDLFEVEVSEASRAAADLDRLIEKRADRLKEEAEQRRVEEPWAESVRRVREQRRRENRAAWYIHHNLAAGHRRSSEEHRVKAERLFEQREGAA